MRPTRSERSAENSSPRSTIQTIATAAKPIRVPVEQAALRPGAGNIVRRPAPPATGASGAPALRVRRAIAEASAPRGTEQEGHHRRGPDRSTLGSVESSSPQPAACPASRRRGSRRGRLRPRPFDRSATVPPNRTAPPGTRPPGRPRGAGAVSATRRPRGPPTPVTTRNPQPSKVWRGRSSPVDERSTARGHPGPPPYDDRRPQLSRPAGCSGQSRGDLGGGGPDRPRQIVEGAAGTSARRPGHRTPWPGTGVGSHEQEVTSSGGPAGLRQPAGRGPPVTTTSQLVSGASRIAWRAPCSGSEDPGSMRQQASRMPSRPRPVTRARRRASTGRHRRGRRGRRPRPPPTQPSRSRPDRRKESRSSSSTMVRWLRRVSWYCRICSLLALAEERQWTCRSSSPGTYSRSAWKARSLIETSSLGVPSWSPDLAGTQRLPGTIRGSTSSSTADDQRRSSAAAPADRCAAPSLVRPGSPRGAGRTARSLLDDPAATQGREPDQVRCGAGRHVDQRTGQREPTRARGGQAHLGALTGHGPRRAEPSCTRARSGSSAKLTAATPITAHATQRSWEDRPATDRVDHVADQGNQQQRAPGGVTTSAQGGHARHT